MVRQPHQHDRIHERGVGHEIAQSAAGEIERLTHCARYHQLSGVIRQERDRGRRVGKFRIRLVYNHNARRGVENPGDGVEGSNVSGGIVGGGDENNVGLVVGDGRQGRLGIDAKVGAAGAVDEGGAGAVRQYGVHGVAGLEAQGGAAGPAEDLQELLEDLVGAVGGPQVSAGDGDTGAVGDVGSEVGAQRGAVPVGVAVEVGGVRFNVAEQVGDERRGG